jgi:hypothetical protein
MAIRNRRLIGVAAVGLFLGVVARVQAQDEQWLQYRSSQDAISVVGGLGRHVVPLSVALPGDLSVPKFKATRPLCGKWATPMTKAGFLWFVLDRSTARGAYDRLYMDSNGNGRLDDETAVKAYRSDSSQAQFGPVKVVLQGEDGPVSFHLEFLVYNSDSSATCYLSAAGWYEGDISIDGVKTHCTLLDYNANGTFNDASADLDAADRIVVGDRETSGSAASVGRYVDVNGTLYELDVAKDGAFVKLKKAQDVQFGQVRVPAGITRLTVNGTNGMFRLKPQDQIARLPLGKYAVAEWSVDRKDDKGRAWTARGDAAGSGQKTIFDAVQGKDAALDIGEPFISQLVVRSSADSYTLQQQLMGRLGERITLLQGNNDRPGPPKVHIRDKEGAYDRTLNFAYG